MERLTERFNNYLGNYIRVKGNKTVYSGEKQKKSYLQNAIIRLAEYEETGLTPDEIVALCEMKNNPPLTLEELREMDGEPVWCCNPKDIQYGHWAIIRNDKFDGPEYNQCAYAVSICWSFSDYGKTWMAYRRKPEN